MGGIIGCRKKCVREKNVSLLGGGRWYWRPFPLSHNSKLTSNRLLTLWTWYYMSSFWSKYVVLNLSYWLGFNKTTILRVYEGTFFSSLMAFVWPCWLSFSSTRSNRNTQVSICYPRKTHAKKIVFQRRLGICFDRIIILCCIVEHRENGPGWNSTSTYLDHISSRPKQMPVLVSSIYTTRAIHI